MSAISLKSITGITSITTPAGVDNVFTVHSNDTTERFRVDSTGNLNIAGIVTVTKDLDVDGHTNLDNISVAGVTTTTGNLNVTDGRILIAQSSGPQIRINSSAADGSSTRFTLGLATGSNNFINGAVANDACVTAPQEIKFGIGNSLSLRIQNDKIITNVDLIPSTNNLRSLGLSNYRWTDLYSVDANISGDLDVDGHTNLDNVSVAGVTTFTGRIDASDNIAITSGNRLYFGNSDVAFIKGVHGGSGYLSFGANNEHMRLTRVGYLLIGTESSRNTRLATNNFIPKIQLEDDAEAAFSMTRFINSGGPPRFVLQKARGTGASPVVVQNNDDIGQILFSGWDGDTFTNGAEIVAEVDGTPGDDQMPGRLIFKTNTGGTANTERLRIDSNGDVGINETNPTQKLHVGGSIKLTAQLMQSMPADFWSQGNTFIELNGIGNLTHQGSFETCLTSNGYRNSSTQWTSYAINSYTGASQIRLNPQGHIIFGTESNKANGSSHNVTERLRIDSSGRVVVGGTSAYIGGAALAVMGTGTTPNTYGSFAIGKIGANPTSGTTLANIRLNGGSVGTRRGAEINAVANGAWSDGSSHPTKLIFAVANVNSASATQRYEINHYGHHIFTNENVLPSSGSAGTNSFKGLTQLGYQHWGHRQYYSGQRNLTQGQHFDLFSNNTAHDDIIFWLNIKGFHSNRTFATAHGTIGGYGMSVSYQSASGVYGSFSGVNIGTGREVLRWTSTSPNSANWWIWGWFSGTSGTGTHTGWAAAQLH